MVDARTGFFPLVLAMNQVDPTTDFSEHPSGDPDADDAAWLSKVFRENEVPLMGYATQLLRDRDRASDVVQDTFVRLCKQRRDRVQGRVRQWLFRVCRNRALDVLKKESRMKTLDDENSPPQTDGDADPSRRAEVAERLSVAESLIGELPPRQQEVIRLKVQGGLSYREISELTGLSVSNVGFLLSTGLKTVRTRMTVAD